MAALQQEHEQQRQLEVLQHQAHLAQLQQLHVGLFTVPVYGYDRISYGRQPYRVEAWLVRLRVMPVSVAYPYRIPYTVLTAA